jgi:hypothetical protein
MSDTGSSKMGCKKTRIKQIVLSVKDKLKNHSLKCPQIVNDLEGPFQKNWA